MQAINRFICVALGCALMGAAGLAEAGCTKSTCGVVTEVESHTTQGEGTGLGAIAGGVVGGLVGNQIGNGTGNTIATIAGAAGGAYAGHQIEKKVRSKANYEVHIKLRNGAARTFAYDNKPDFSSGDKVQIKNGQLVKLGN